MTEVLEIKFEGWTATPRMPFVLSGNAMCLPVPTYSLLLGVIGCCMGRLVTSDEVKIGYYYEFDTINEDMETRHRLEFDGKRIKSHSKGTDAYLREYHANPKLTLWIDRLDWFDSFKYPIGTPSLGRSQDVLTIKSVEKQNVKKVENAIISGCMLPFSSGLKIGGQLVQLAEAYQENEEIGSGRTATQSRIFMAIPHDNRSNIAFESLYETSNNCSFYLHQWS